MTHSTVKRLTKPLDETKREFQRLRKAAMCSHQNKSLAIAERNLFDDEASSSYNTGAKPPTPLKTLHEHSHSNSSGRTSTLRDLILRFKEGGDEPIKSAWICFQDLIKQVPHHGIQKWLLNDDTPPWGNNKRKEKGQDGPKWIIRSKFEDELANFMLEKKSHAKGIRDMLVQHYELVPILLGRPFLAMVRVVIDVHEGKLSLRVESETVTFNIGNFMKTKHSHDDYLYCADHTAKLVQEQWVNKVNHDGEWTKEEEEDDPNEVLAVCFYLRTKPVEPLKWKASENRLKPSSVEPPKLELKELPKHLEYAFLQENNQLLMVISSALSTVKKTKLLEVLRNRNRGDRLEYYRH
ncbi:hypothetical protein Tco_0484741 [Tanacetum coccineum]